MTSSPSCIHGNTKLHLLQLWEPQHWWSRRDYNHQQGRTRNYSATHLPDYECVFALWFSLSGGEDRNDFLEFLYQDSFLKLLRADGLPPISRFSTFIATEGLCCHRRIEGASLAGMGAKMPNLETIEWWVHDDEKKYAEVRRMHRFGQLEVFNVLSNQKFQELRNTPPLSNLSVSALLKFKLIENPLYRIRTISLHTPPSSITIWSISISYPRWALWQRNALVIMISTFGINDEVQSDPG